MAATNFDPIANQSGPMSLTVAAVNADPRIRARADLVCTCLLYTSDAADE